MRIPQIIAAVVVVVGLAGLIGWQRHRDGLVTACHAAGNVWDGARSQCREAVRPILQRDLRRG
jgi:hypothetical protein